MCRNLHAAVAERVVDCFRTMCDTINDKRTCVDRDEELVPKCTVANVDTLSVKPGPAFNARTSVKAHSRNVRVALVTVTLSVGHAVVVTRAPALS